MARTDRRGCAPRAEAAKRGAARGSSPSGLEAPATGAADQGGSLEGGCAETASSGGGFLTPLTSASGRQFDVDLFGEPIVRGLGRGRPPHVPTPATRALVIELRAAGGTGKAIAQAMGIGRTVLYRDYAAEMGATPARAVDCHDPKS